MKSTSYDTPTDDPSFGYTNFRMESAKMREIHKKNNAQGTTNGRTFTENTPPPATTPATPPDPITSNNATNTTMASVMAAASAFFVSGAKVVATGLKNTCLYSGAFIGGSCVASAPIHTIYILKNEPNREGMKKLITPLRDLGIGALLIGATQWMGSASQKSALATTAIVGGVLTGAGVIAAQIVVSSRKTPKSSASTTT